MLFDGVLVIFGGSFWIVSIPDYSVFGVILSAAVAEGVAADEFVVLLGEVSAGHGSPISLLLAMHAFFEPVGHEGACVRERVPCPTLACLLYESIWVGLFVSIDFCGKL